MRVHSVVHLIKPSLSGLYQAILIYGGGTQENGLGKQHVVAGLAPRAVWWLSGVCSANRATQDTPM